MAKLDRNTLIGKFNSLVSGLFKTNTSKAIGSDDMRTFVQDIADSSINSTDDVLDEDDMASNSASAVPSQQSTKAYVDNSITSREFNRTFSETLVFDKNEIEYEEHELTGDLEYTVASSGHLSNQFSSAVQRVVTDGTRVVTFTGFNFVLGDIQSGSIPDAGTYLVLFLYWNGVATVNWTKPSLEVANLTPLSAPGSFDAAMDGATPTTIINLSWAGVANASSFEIQYSAVSDAGPWTTLTNPASGDTSYSHTGLNPGTTYYYRIRAIGDQLTFSNSQYSASAATTANSGDVTAPTFVFEPADAATDIPMNAVVTITASEAMRDADGVTVITNANVANYLVVKENDGAGANIPFTASIDASKTIITITPNLVWPALGDVFIQIDGVEDVNGNESTADDATFTANDYTLMNANYLNLGLQFDSVVTGNDINFELEYTFKDALFSGVRGLFQKKDNDPNNVSFQWATDDNDVFFVFYPTNAGNYRKLTWTGALTGITSGKITLKYFGTIDTNNGLDRADLYLDDVLVGSKSLSILSGMATWPYGIAASTAPLYISGPTTREVKDAFIRSNSGATTEGSYPIIRTGEDQSGNNRDGTWL